MILAIFSIMMLLIYIRPFGIPIWIFSVSGAILCFIFGIVDFSDVAFVWGMVGDSLLTLIGLIILTLALEKLGFFDFLALKIIHFSQYSKPKDTTFKPDSKNLNNLDSTLQDSAQATLKSQSPNKSQYSPKTPEIKTWKFAILMLLFGAFLAGFFSNDGAILVLTPLMIAFGFKDSRALIAFLLLSSFISDFFSNTLIISNLTNIITADFFDIDSLRFSLVMALPSIFTILISGIIFLLIIKKFLPPNLTFDKNLSKNNAIFTSQIPQDSTNLSQNLALNLTKHSNNFLQVSTNLPQNIALNPRLNLAQSSQDSTNLTPDLLKSQAQIDSQVSQDVANPSQTQKIPLDSAKKTHKDSQDSPTKTNIFFCILFIFLLIIGIAFRDLFSLPVSFFTLISAFCAIFYATLTKRARFSHIFRESPLSIVLFGFGLFVVVFALQSIGITEFLENIFLKLKNAGLFFGIIGAGFLSSLGSSVINNLPMMMIANLSIADFSPHDIATQSLIYANILGCNIGAKLTPIGSLATLLWIYGLKRYGINISFKTYMFSAILIVPIVLFFALFGLFIHLSIF
ncbi:hypothetical protein CCY99_07360 [Helicobacter sp. 16-1353]|uniref:ArsB/NhaD family transporter n=1 Tax=Helicobacter sp. 16-1353 TaxID=2004996 RepID=UPI000DCB1F61|nr:ArsB/NhaD family transporter [Helicobacter sp. 16-1353]RAX52456.1 hypothetical protein CCY99_07360 [Helicobacter sp. 16-1353]